MSEYRSDEEQVEALKIWWNENGTSLILTVAFSLAIVFGFRMWQADVKEKGEAASSQYQDLADTLLVPPGQKVDASGVKTSKYLAESLKKSHEDSTYARFASLAMAKEAVAEGDLAKAEEELRWVLSSGGEGEILILAKMRLARVLTAEAKYEEALALLDMKDPGSYRSAVNEVRGDVYFRMGKTAEAREAYTNALDALPEKESRPMLQMKLDDLAKPAEVAPAVDAAEAQTGSGQAAGEEN